MEKYKIALVSDWYYPRVGGIEYAINALARNLQHRGHDVHIVTGNPSAVQHPGNGDGFTVIRLKGRFLAGALVSPKAFHDLYHTLRRGRYDIVHTHGLDSPMAMISLLLAKMIGIPALMTNHSLIGQVPLRPVLCAGARGFLRHAKAVIAVSARVEEESRHLTQGPVYRVPNGLDTYSPNGAVQPKKLDHPGKILIVTVSRMTGKKEVDRIVRIGPSLLKRHPNLVFVMVGDGPLKEPLEKEVQARGLAAHFWFAGSVSRETVFHLLKQGQIFILPCTREAFGIVILEAFLMGVPVIAMQQSGAAEVVTHGKTGLLANDDEDLIRCVEELIAHPQRAASLASAAYQEVEKYQWPNITKQIESIYASLINGKRSSHS